MVPNSLRKWFVVHFVADTIFAIPLLFAPVAFLTLLGWETVDPLTTRLVGAAMLAIGVESLLGRNAGVESFEGMLNLKLIWSGAASLGILVTIVTVGGPAVGWLFLALFVAFHLLWLYYRLRLRTAVKERT
ncbi:MAG: hypothetical protein GWP61_17885 [Chloroflexi bacterium]|jgi:hypothetical protein|nr:hypothetical protein [Chloroflexota bacterium]